MDLSDILSTFFVSKAKRGGSEKQVSSVCTQTETETKASSAGLAEEVEEIPDEKASSSSSSSSSGSSSTESIACSSTVKERNTATQVEEETFSDGGEGFVVKKLVLKGVDMSKRNILIANTEMAEGVTVLSEVIDSLSLIRGVDELYNGSIYVITSGENRPIFKQMLLDNPYMYFTDFTVKGSIAKKKIEEMSTSPKKTLVVVDVNVKMDLEKLMQPNIQLFVMGTSSEAVEFYKKLGDNKMVLYKKEKLKSLQKRFFNLFVKEICGLGVKFEDYYEYLNKSVFGVKYIIIKGRELRYY